MLVSHQKVNLKEVIVEWYSTDLGVTGGNALIHEFYSSKVPNLVHLTVDTGFRNGQGTIKAYVSFNLPLGDQQLAAQFQEIPLDLRMVEAERIGFDILKTTVILSLSPAELLLGKPLYKQTEKSLLAYSGPSLDVPVEHASGEYFKDGGASDKRYAWYGASSKGVAGVFSTK
ncbi:hypothetical protein F2P56_020082 [Juglans regia]|uniref:Uncharacterized protein n=2 Tax=Juglans regia TaxID=51240 RepID=A0A833X5N3_JUGRE|nr:eukaryotic translation initiation factor 3 subunit F-like [Juglans regia]KAF5460196.1 hypothetical protein F2P56_020082 [Juglans regia]